MIQKLSRTGRMEGRVAKQNWGEVHLRSCCQNEKKKRKIHQVILSKWKEIKQDLSSRFCPNETKKKRVHHVTIVEKKRKLKSPTLPGQAGDGGGGGGNIGEAGDGQRIRGGQTSDRYWCWRHFWKAFWLLLLFFLVVYNRQVTGTDLGMDKHQILIVKIFCELFGWDGQSSEQVVSVSQQLIFKDQKWTDFWIQVLKILTKLCSFCRYHIHRKKYLFVLIFRIFGCPKRIHFWLSVFSKSYGCTKLAVMERNFIQVLFFWLFLKS